MPKRVFLNYALIWQWVGNLLSPADLVRNIGSRSPIRLLLLSNADDGPPTALHISGPHEKPNAHRPLPRRIALPRRMHPYNVNPFFTTGLEPDATLLMGMG